MTLHFGCGGRR